MIPKFPKFKDLELSDQKDIEKVTKQYLPYCDFNFEIMWAWDYNNSAKISILNENLVLIQKNVFTEEISTSFLGNNNLESTLEEIFDFLDSTKVKDSKLSLVPEDSLKGLNFKKYFIEIDLGACDYIYSLKDLADFLGHKYSKKRGKYNLFFRNYPEVTIKELDLNSDIIKKEVVGLNSFWAQNKTIIDLENFNENELLAIDRFIEAKFKNTICIGVFDKNKLIGYSIFSTSSDKFCIAHFTKADVSYKGIYEFLMNNSAKILINKGYEFMNFQEDMNIESLREAKISYRPTRFLRKYFLRRL